ADRIRLITAEVGRVTNGFLMPLLNLATEGLVILGIAVLLLMVHPAAALLAAVLVGGVGAFLQRAFKRRLEEYREARVLTNTAMYKWVGQGLGALKETKALGREDYFLRRFGENSQGYARATSTFTALNLMPRLAVETLAVAALLLSVVVGLAIGQPMSGMVPLLTLFGLAAVRIMPSATRIMGALNNLRFYAPSVDTVATDLAEVEQARGAVPAHPADGAIHPPSAGTFEVRDVTYRYPGAERDSLRQVDFRVGRGEIVGVIGRSGSGKTTLADIVLGLLEPDSGSILVDGVDLRDRGGRMRGLAGLVPQQFFLLDDTVRRNVAFGREDAEIDDARVWDALEGAQLAAKVRALPGGLDETVREQGAILSGGERQRLSIARALYDNPSILVLDEATSALDSATESALMETLRHLAATRAIVLVTHRPLSMAACHRVILMAEGRVVAAGTYDELAAHDAAFGEMMRAEVGESVPRD
ncbi:MAG: ABC transporter ATP-binding protein, partial [Rhodocyclaceae bacterium]|nr:ABC transporter ATP-binding protein [Rhodocyclaceae bacterium]